MSMPQQLTHIPIFRTGDPHPREAFFQQQLQDELGILPVRFLLADSRRLDLRWISDP
jgi:hypothetical protein